MKTPKVSFSQLNAISWAAEYNDDERKAPAALEGTYGPKFVDLLIKLGVVECARAFASRNGRALPLGGHAATERGLAVLVAEGRR